MKKLILLVFILSCTYNLNAQCDSSLPMSEDFSDSNAVNFCWDFIDDDNDGFGWSIVDLGGGNQGLKSYSWIGFALTPDNWIITNVIDLTSSSSVELTWKVRATAWNFDNENYSVYAATGNQISDFTSSPVSFTENLNGSDASGVFANRSLDISSLAGQMVYIAFRHHDVTDQKQIDIDDFAISSSTLGVDDFETSSFKHYYNTENNILTLKSSNRPIDYIEIFNLLGQKVVSEKLSQTNETIDLSTIVDGIYLARVTIDNTTKTIKFLKQ